MAARAAFAVALLLACAACTKKAPRGPGRIIALQTDVVGLSGLTLDEHGAFWAPGEAGDAVVRIDPVTFGVTRYEVGGGAPGTRIVSGEPPPDVRSIRTIQASAFGAVSCHSNAGGTKPGGKTLSSSG